MNSIKTKNKNKNKNKKVKTEKKIWPKQTFMLSWRILNMNAYM